MVDGPDPQKETGGERQAGDGPRSIAAIFEAAVADQEAGRTGKAQAGYTQVLALDPGHIDARLNLAVILANQGRLNDALQSCKRAIAIAPRSPRAHSDSGSFLQRLGRLDEAKAAFRKAIDLKPDFGEPYLHLAILASADKGPDGAARLNQTLALMDRDAHRLAPFERNKLMFGRAKVLEALGQYDRAFETLAEANAMVRAGRPYDIAVAERHLQSIAEAFDSALLTRLRGEGLANPRPIFIVGMPRSGTTLVEQIVSAHPKVQGAGELPNLSNITRATRRNDGAPYPAWAPTMTGQDCRNLGRAYLDGLPPAGPGETRLTDKGLTNYEHIGLIHLALPGASIINCRRDPRDIALSAFAIQFNPGHQEFSYDLADIGRYWRAYDRLMAHWDAVLPTGRVLHAPYESVVEDVETWARRLIAHCGLEWDDACLRFFESTRAVDTASLSQVRKPIYSGSVGRWRRFERHLGPLLESLGEPYGSSPPPEG
jgi:tetratricopeptide (TPR) repeat protein